MRNDIKVEAASDYELGHRQRDASRLRVAIFSDALPHATGPGPTTVTWPRSSDRNSVN